MERTFAKEVEMLRRGDGEYFEGEGILAITKALLQSGVSYVGGYQGALTEQRKSKISQTRKIISKICLTNI